jgi:hypothetical protein
LIFHLLAFMNSDVEPGLSLQLANWRSESLANGGAGGLASGGCPERGFSLGC